MRWFRYCILLAYNMLASSPVRHCCSNVVMFKYPDFRRFFEYYLVKEMMAKTTRQEFLKVATEDVPTEKYSVENVD